jgi:hypothetical protein
MINLRFYFLLLILIITHMVMNFRNTNSSTASDLAVHGTGG